MRVRLSQYTVGVSEERGGWHARPRNVSSDFHCVSLYSVSLFRSHASAHSLITFPSRITLPISPSLVECVCVRDLKWKSRDENEEEEGSEGDSNGRSSSSHRSISCRRRDTATASVITTVAAYVRECVYERRHSLDSPCSSSTLISSS